MLLWGLVVGTVGLVVVTVGLIVGVSVGLVVYCGD